MLKFFAILLATLAIVACGGPDDVDAIQAGEGSIVDVTMCSCVNEPILSNTKANACTHMMASKTPEEITLETMACRKTLDVPEGGPDLCFCMRTMSEDPGIRSACEAILPDDMSPREITAKLVECGK